MLCNERKGIEKNTDPWYLAQKTSYWRTISTAKLTATKSTATRKSKEFHGKAETRAATEESRIIHELKRDELRRKVEIPRHCIRFAPYMH